MNRSIKKSKLLSKVLRHQPGLAAVTPDSNGWISTADLLAGLERLGEPISLEQLTEIVRTNDKQRFAFNADSTKIRANQGHSIDVDLDLTVKEPPPVLYHGTAAKRLNAIKREGLTRQSRHDVHLHTDKNLARKVGQRHGVPVLLRIDSRTMAADGVTFRCSENGVWLTEAVPARYIEVNDE